MSCLARRSGTVKRRCCGTPPPDTLVGVDLRGVNTASVASPGTWECGDARNVADIEILRLERSGSRCGVETAEWCFRTLDFIDVGFFLAELGSTQILVHRVALLHEQVNPIKRDLL